MSQNGFLPAEKRTLVYEGGKVDNPRDPGGRTNQGVIERVYDGYRDRKGLPRRSVYLMEPAERDEIYRLQYWAPIHGDALPQGIDGVLFDGAVNSGSSQSIKWVQRALPGIRVDGAMGQATLAAIVAADQTTLINATCDRRQAFVRALRTYRTFGRGWESRIAQVRAAGLAALANQSAPVAVYADGAHGKANLEDAKRLPPTAIAHAVSGGGAAAMALQQFTGSLEPLRAWLPIVGHAVDVVTAAGGVMMAGGVAYGGWAIRRAGQLNDALDLGIPAGAAPAGAPA